LNVTVPVVGGEEPPGGAPAVGISKLKPLIVTLVPTGPVTGLSPVMVGLDGTVNITALLTPHVGLPAVTTTGPVVTPAGAALDSTGAITSIEVGVQFVTCADIPLNVTDDTFDPKLVPTIRTNVPGRPEAGMMLVMDNASSGIALELLPE
jgi:hypothetical protein